MNQQQPTTAPTPATKEKNPVFRVRLYSVGNPDHGQYTAVSNPSVVTSDSIASIISEAAEYIEFWDLGGGNWPSPWVTMNGKKIGRLSYNGRMITETKTPTMIGA